jgi:hypothetical protein
MNDKKTAWVWVGIAVVVVVAIAALIVWFMHRAPNVSTANHAPAGQTVAGFPQGLAPAATGTVSATSTLTNSYSINYSTSTSQYTTEWVTSSTPAAVFAHYQAYVAANGWTVTNQADTATLKGIYADTATSSVSIIITPKGKGSSVTVTYVVK